MSLEEKKAFYDIPEERMRAFKDFVKYRLYTGPDPPKDQEPETIYDVRDRFYKSIEDKLEDGTLEDGGALDGGSLHDSSML